IGQMLAWKRGDLPGALQRLRLAFFLGVLALGFFGVSHGAPYLSAVAGAIAVYVIVGALIDLAQRAVSNARTPRAALARFFGLPLSAFGTSFAHAGIGLTLLGLAATGWGVESITTMR